MRFARSIGLAVVCAIAASTLGPLSAGATIAGSEHDFSSFMGDLCSSCHAPHHVPNSSLLWNHQLSANSFSWSDWTKTTNDTTLPTNIATWTGSTKMCLSCHDGSVIVGAVYVGPNSSPETIGNLQVTGDHVITTTSGSVSDLKGNHPVALPFPYGGVANTYNGITTGDNALTSGWVATPTKVKIYTDPAGGANNHGIECASCHDPHGTANKDFLRDTTAGSALCLDCHAK